MKERSLARLANIQARFGTRIAEGEASLRADREAFLARFRAVRQSVIAPVLHEVAEELSRSGGRHEVVLSDDDPPTAKLRSFLTTARPEGHTIAFEPIDRGRGPEVLVWLEASPPVMDLARYAPESLTRDVVEQIVVDAVEQIYACVAELRPRR
jgi:hypothetical protein